MAQSKSILYPDIIASREMDVQSAFFVAAGSVRRSQMI